MYASTVLTFLKPELVLFTDNNCEAFFKVEANVSVSQLHLTLPANKKQGQPL